MWPSSSCPSRLELHGAGDVAGKYIGLEVHPVARLFGPQGGVGQGVGHDIDAKAIVLDLVDGERDAVEADRALGRKVARQLRRRLDRQTPRAAVGSHIDYAADAVDVARHDMPAQLIAGLERALQVDAPARLPFPERP